MSKVKVDMDDIIQDNWLDCLASFGNICINQDDTDFHATSVEDGVMTTSEVARSDSGFILNTNKECHNSTSGTTENTVETSRKSLSFQNNQSILSEVELDREGNGVVHNLSIECSKATTANLSTPSNVTYQTIYEIENIEGKVLGVVMDDKLEVEGIPLHAKENENALLEIKFSKELSWIQCHSCGTFLQNQANLEYHIACRHYSPKIFDETFDDRDQADEEEEAKESDVQFVMEEETVIKSDVRMTRWCQCETCHDFLFSEDDRLRHLCSNPKGHEDSNSLNDPYDFDLDSGEVENYAERSDTQLILSKSRSGQITQKSQKTNANCSNRKTRGKCGISGVQKEACHTIPRKSERLRQRLGLPEKRQMSMSNVDKRGISGVQKEACHTIPRKSERLRQRLGLPEKRQISVSNVVVRRSRRCKQIMESRKMKLRSDGSTSINEKGENRDCCERYKCYICPKNFNYPTDLKRHIRSHLGLKFFKCQTCSKSFVQKCSLVEHQRVHTGEKPFHCSVCSKSFSCRSNLMRHKLIHTGERRHPCQICGKSFSLMSTLKDHLSVHNPNLRRFSCVFCEKRFSRNFFLLRHRCSHINERTCKICHKEFSRVSSLRRHVKWVHKKLR